MKKRKVLITGASGMVGRNLILNAKSQEFACITPNRNELDLDNYAMLIKYLENERPDTVVHCAGYVGGIQANINDPVAFLTKNIQIGINLVRASFETKTPNFINLGSSCIYPKDAINPILESSLLTGTLEPTNEAYALAKIVIAKYCEYVTRISSSLNYKTIIPCNLYGKYDNFDLIRSHLVPSVIQKVYMAQINGDNSVEIWGDGTVRREFMYAEDFADALWFCVHNIEKLPNYLNVGLGYDHSVFEYYTMVADILDYRGDFVFATEKPVGMKQKLVDSRLLNKLGWQSQIDQYDGLKKTIEYFKNVVLSV